jgi:hypothetical protein
MGHYALVGQDRQIERAAPKDGPLRLSEIYRWPALSVQGSGTDLAAGILPVKLEDNSLGLGRIKLAQDHVELLFHSVVLLLRLRRADVE